MLPPILLPCDFHTILFLPDLTLIGFVEAEKMPECIHTPSLSSILPLSLLPASFIPSPILSKMLLATDHYSTCKEPEHDLTGNPQPAQTDDHTITHLINLFLALLYIEQSRLIVSYLTGYS